MTDIKHICTDLIELWDADCDIDVEINKLRAALAEPETKWPTRQELKTFACEWWRKFGYVKDKAACEWIIDDIDPEHFVDFMGDTLARWGS